MKTTKIFFDTEFTGLHQNTTLISIGLVAETGATFYAELTDYDPKQVDDWIRDNVISNLEFNDESLKGMSTVTFLTEGDKFRGFGDTQTIKKYLTNWLSQFEHVEMWSDCLAYDWVLFCHIFGHAFAIPNNICYIPFDISTLLHTKGIDPDVNREMYAFYGTPQVNAKKHNALWDAEVIMLCYKRLTNV